MITKTRALAVLGAVALALGAILAGCASPTSAAPAAQHRSTCNFLQQGKGTGAALSATPKSKVPRGQIATMRDINGGAWQVCYDGSTGLIWLRAKPDRCAESTEGWVKWEPCDTAAGFIWHNYPQNGGGSEYRNFAAGPHNGLDICGGSVGSRVKPTARKYCSKYHRVFLFHQVGTVYLIHL